MQCIDDRERRRTAVLQHRYQHTSVSVLPHDIGLWREAVAHVSHFTQIGRRAIERAHRNVVEPFHRSGRAVHIDRVFLRPDLGRAGWQNQVLRIERADHIRRRQAFGEQRARVEVDRDQPRFAAVRIRHGRARNRHQLRAQEVQRSVVERLLGELWARQAELDHRDAGSRVTDHQGRRRARRHLLELCLLDGHRLRNRGLDVRVRLQEHLEDRDARQRLRFDVLDVVDGGGQTALVDGRDAVGHVFGRQARVIPDDADHRNIDFRQHVDRRGQQHEWRRQQDQNGHHDERVWPLKRNVDDPHETRPRECR
jgi:hypothetical protein